MNRLEMRAWILKSILGLVLATYLTGMASQPGEAQQIHAVKITDEILIDGSLDEAIWSELTPIHIKYESWPDETRIVVPGAVARIAYDQKYLYAAIVVSDPEPEKIRAHLTDRDRAFNDDFVGIVIDTFNDERRAYEFFVNPLGIQMDLIKDDVANTEDSSWDAIWHSAGQLVETGYVVEMAIPFNQLRFQKGNGPQTWGLDVIRVLPRDQRQVIRIQKINPNKSGYLNQISKISGFQNVSSGSNLQITPSFTAFRRDVRDESGDLAKSDSAEDPGLFIKWGITPNVTLNAVVNPDFSQVEADAAQLTANNQFALFFDEKRPLFLEGADYFHTPVKVVHTRMIADPSEAVKVTGKQGSHNFGIFMARDKVTNILLPGLEGSSLANLDQETRDTVARYRRDFGKKATLGLILTDREGDGYENQVVGVDGKWRLTNKDTFVFQALASRTQNPLALESSQAVADDFSGKAILLNYWHSVKNWWVDLAYHQFDEGFRADLGFVGQVNYHKASVFTGYNWLRDSGFFSRNGISTRVQRTEDGNGQLYLEEAWIEFSAGMPRQSFASLTPVHRSQVFKGVTYDLFFNEFFFETKPGGMVSFSLSGSYGDWIDFSQGRPAERFNASPSVSLNLGRRFRLQFQHLHSQLDVEGTRLFTAEMPQLNVTWQKSRRLFVRTILQYADIRRNDALYQEPVETETRDLQAQILFSYKVNPQTVFFVGYNDNRNGNDQMDLIQLDRSFFLKGSYAWTR